MRYFIDISYLGTNYHGWQIQNNAITIQKKLEESLSILLRDKIKTIGCGRTDTGVHAISQVVHFDFDTIDEDNFIYRLNAILPKDISVNSIKEVNKDANARFDAISREYIYKIHIHKNPFLENRSLFYKGKINLDLLNNACKILMDSSNFQSFSKVNTEVNNFKCSINFARFNKLDNGFNFEISSNRFLRGMVRSIMGTLLDINEKKISLEHLSVIIKNKDRSGAGASVLPCGLYLSKVDYPKQIYI